MRTLCLFMSPFPLFWSEDVQSRCTFVTLPTLPGCRHCCSWWQIWHRQGRVHHAHSRYLYMGKHHDDVIKWKHFPRYWPFVRGIQRFPVNSPHKGQWHGALMFSLICVWINGWVNNREAVDLRRYLAHYDAISTIENLVWGTNTHLCNQSALLMDITKSNYISHQMEAQPPQTETNIEQRAICMKPLMQRMHIKMTTELVNTTTR